MALKDNASLALIPAAYKTSKVYSAIPTNGDGDFTFSRSGTGATRINKAGLVETMGTNVPRLNYDLTNGTPASCPSLLLEPSRTNLITRSYEFGTIWAKGGSTTVTTNFSTAPDGTNTASRLQMPSGFGTYLSIAASMSSGTNYSLTFYIKNNGGQALDFGVWQTSSGGTKTDSLLVTPTNEWIRYELNFTADSNSNYVFLDNNNNSSSVDCLIWGAQLEAGTYSTSLIPTSGGVVTRVVDNCYINSGLQNILNTSEGTLFVDVEVPRVSTTSDFERIVLSDQNSATDRIIFDNYAGNWRVLLISTNVDASKTIVSVTANQRIKVAIAYSSTGLRISYDGNTATTTSGTYNPTTTLESFKFSNKDGGSKWQGKIHQAIYFNTALTNAELQTLTT